jgi:DNA-directed RNA polymerase specialized sigma24 family protein
MTHPAPRLRHRLAKVDAEQLRAAIAALPAPFRETLILRDIEGLDYREIAQTTEIPIGTVMSLEIEPERLVGVNRRAVPIRLCAKSQ